MKQLLKRLKIQIIRLRKQNKLLPAQSLNCSSFSAKIQGIWSDVPNYLLKLQKSFQGGRKNAHTSSTKTGRKASSYQLSLAILNGRCIKLVFWLAPKRTQSHLSTIHGCTSHSTNLTLKGTTKRQLQRNSPSSCLSKQMLLIL